MISAAEQPLHSTPSEMYHNNPSSRQEQVRVF